MFIRGLLTLLFCSLLASPGWAATPTHDVSSNSGVKSNESATSAYSHVAGTLANGIAIIRVSSQDTTPGTISGVTYNGAAAIQCPAGSPTSFASSNRNAISLWYYLSPPAGSAAVVATFSEVMNSHIVSVSTYSNVDQSSPIGTCNAAVNFDATAPSEARVTVSSAVGELVVAIGSFASSTNTPTSSHDVRAAVLNSGNHNHCGTDTAGADTTVNMSCADAGSFSNAILGVSLKPSSGAILQSRPLPRFLFE